MDEEDTLSDEETGSALACSEDGGRRCKTRRSCVARGAPAADEGVEDDGAGIDDADDAGAPPRELVDGAALPDGRVRMRGSCCCDEPREAEESPPDEPDCDVAARLGADRGGKGGEASTAAFHLRTIRCHKFAPVWHE